MDENASYLKYNLLLKNLNYYIVQYLTRKCIDFNNSYKCIDTKIVKGKIYIVNFIILKESTSHNGGVLYLLKSSF